MDGRLVLAPESAANDLDRIEAAFAQACEDCARRIDVVRGLSDLRPADHIVWVHDPACSPTEDEVAKLGSVERSRVLPVVPDNPAAASLPAALRMNNAMPRVMFGEAWAVAVADELASRMWMRRRARRMFISYKRSDSLGVAHQLYAALIEQRWKVFLDDHSIDWGEHFQDELHWELDDVDLVILLVSPNVHHSKWVMEEIASANKRDVGLVCVVWPNPWPEASKVLENVFPVQRVQLDARDFDDLGQTGPLTCSALERVVAAAYSSRASGVARRTALQESSLTSRLTQVAIDLSPTGESGDFLGTTASGDGAVFVRVLPFRPGPLELFDLRDHAPQGVQLAVCVYMESRPDDRRVSALRWLLEGDGTRPYRLIAGALT
jgi:hypothetical protein